MQMANYDKMSGVIGMARKATIPFEAWNSHYRLNFG
jgi:hypothetical protein